MGSPHIEKRCSDCKTVKPVDQFYRAGRCRDRYCRACRRIRDRARDKKKPSPQQINARRDYKLRRLYGIGLADYTAMLEKQNGRCAICRSEETRSVYGEVPLLVVDHNHSTGKIRALLCTSCNCALAAIEDEQFMLRAKEYLRRHDGCVFVGDYDL